MFAREIRRVVPHQSHLSVVYWNLFFVRVTKYYEKLRRRKACNKRSREIATLVRLSFRSTKNGLFRFLFLPSCLPIFISFPLVPISLQNCLSLPSTPNNVTFCCCCVTTGLMCYLKLFAGRTKLFSKLSKSVRPLQNSPEAPLRLHKRTPKINGTKRRKENLFELICFLFSRISSPPPPPYTHTYTLSSSVRTYSH